MRLGPPLRVLLGIALLGISYVYFDQFKTLMNMTEWEFVFGSFTGGGGALIIILELFGAW